MMDKNEIIERLERLARCAVHTVGELPFVMSLDDGIAIHEAIDMLRSQLEPHWIPCSEMLPAYGEDVLLSVGEYCTVGHIVPVNDEEQYHWYFSGWYHLPNDVTAWMPLPEPYKEDEHEAV